MLRPVTLSAFDTQMPPNGYRLTASAVKCTKRQQLVLRASFFALQTTDSRFFERCAAFVKSQVAQRAVNFR
jgi:hypothetical protein